MEKLRKLKETLMEELEQIAKKGEVKAGELDAIHKLTDTIKNIDKICALERSDYSQSGDWEAEMRGTYGGGNSYAGIGMGRNGYGQSGGGGYSGRHRDGRGRYSRDGGYSMDSGRDEMLEHVDMMMQSAGDDRTRDMIHRFREQLERS